MQPVITLARGRELDRLASLQILLDAEDTAEQLRRWKSYDRDRRRRGVARALTTSAAAVVIFTLTVLLAVVLISPHRTPGSAYGDALGVPETPSPCAAAVWTQPALMALAGEVAAAHGIPPRLLTAQVGVESAWDPLAVGQAGEVGLLQLSPAVARRWAVNPHDPRQNLTGGALELRSHYDSTGGNWTLALARYNGRGPRARAYAQRVLRAWEVAK